MSTASATTGLPTVLRDAEFLIGPIGNHNDAAPGYVLRDIARNRDYPFQLESTARRAHHVILNERAAHVLDRSEDIAVHSPADLNVYMVDPNSWVDPR